MKKVYLLLVMGLFAFTANAQFIYNDYDDNQNVVFEGWPNWPQLVANPDASGINTSANVAEFVRTGETWANVGKLLPGNIDFSNGTTFSLKIYSPIICDVLFKLEGSANPVEVFASVTEVNTWQLLEFDFPGAPSDTYNNIVMFFDFATNNDNTFYFDDVEGPAYIEIEEKPYLAANVQDNFEDDGWGTITEWFFQDPDLNPLLTIADPADASNTVADYNRTGNFFYTNAQTVLEHRMDLRERNTFELRVYFPSANDYTGMLNPTAAVKLQNSLLGGNAWQTQVEVVKTIEVFDEWVSLSFDFSSAYDRSDFDQVVIQLGGEGWDHNVPGQFYFDDLELIVPVYPVPEYTYNDFDANQNNEFSGDPVLPTIVANPDISGINTSANVAEYTKSGEDWAFVYTELDELINFDNGTNFQLKVHSSIVADVTFKLENRYASWISTERKTTIADTDEWVLLNFNFDDAPSGTYSKIVIFFGFAETMGETFYFDDVVGPVYDTPKEYLEDNVQDNFEDDGWATLSNWKFQDPDFNDLSTTTDPLDATNTVADYNRSGAFPYTNAQVELDHKLDLSERNKFELNVYFPSSNDYSGDMGAKAAIKLQNSLYIENAWWTQAEIVLDVTEFDQWVTLLFDFSDWSESIDYDQIVVQLGGEGHNVAAQFYFDDLYLKHVPYITVESPNGGELIEQNSSHIIEWDYDYWEGTIDIELIKEGELAVPVVLNLSASDTVFEWNVFSDQEPGEDYRIIITSTENSFPTDTSDAYFTIVEVDGVVANFSAEPTLILEGESVTFTDLSSGEPDSWAWFFEGGTPETFDGQTPPVILYETPGAYDVSLTVYKGDDQDVTLKEDYIEVTEVLELTPPNSLQAEVGGYDDVMLTWNAPGETSSELIYDNDATTGAYSYEGYTMATHMSPEGSCKVLALKYYTTIQDGDNTFNANVYGWDGSQPGTELLYTEAVTAEDEMWIVVDVSSEDINFTGDFVVGFGSINATTFMGYDGDLNNGRSWDFDNDQTWASWSEAYLVRAIVEYADGKVVEIGNTSTTINNTLSRSGCSVHSSDYSEVEVVDPIVSQNSQQRSLLGYNVYRDNIKINPELVEVTSYHDLLPPIGTREYYVTAIYEAGESEASNVVSVVVTDINEISTNSVVVYPNPTDGLFTVTVDEKVAVDLSLIDMTGKEVFKSIVEQTSTFNVSGLQSGIYFLRIVDKSSNKTNFKKLIIK